MLGFLGDIYLAADLEIGNARHAGEIPEPKARVAGPGNANQPPQQRALTLKAELLRCLPSQSATT